VKTVSNEVMRSKYLAFGLILVGLLLALAATILSVSTGKSEPKPPPAALRSSSAPSSTKLSQNTIDSYAVAADLPKYIEIPSIGIGRARVIQLGLMKNGSIAVPGNIYDTGWYTGSSKPGQPGAMFIYGHVSSWQANGVFYNLKKLQPGDKVIVTRGDNKIFTYRVVTNKVYSYNSVDMNQVLAPINRGVPGLNLMTCTGQIIKGTSEFNQRLVVFASLISSG